MLTSRLPSVIIASSSGVEGCLDVYAILYGIAAMFCGRHVCTKIHLNITRALLSLSLVISGPLTISSVSFLFSQIPPSLKDRYLH